MSEEEPLEELIKKEPVLQTISKDYNILHAIIFKTYDQKKYYQITFKAKKTEEEKK